FINYPKKSASWLHWLILFDARMLTCA
ncbi:MAG: hypothetical protein V7642_3394, partial [Burkholderiales bacterium]